MDPNQQYGQPQQPYNPNQPPQYAPPPPQQPYGQMPPPNQYGAPPPAASANRWGPSSIGLEPNVAAGLGYLIPIVGLIFFFIEKTNRFVKFNGAQAILITIGYFVVGIIQIVLGIFGAVADNAAGGTGAIALITGLGSCLFGILYLGLFALQIWGIIAGFMGNYVKFPIVGALAERWAGGPPQPAF